MQTELQEFVKESLREKVPRTQIQQALKDAGWPDDEVAAALSAYADTDSVVPVPKRKVQVSAGETFKYLSAFACLATSATALGRLVFHFVDRLIDDPLSPYGDYDLVGVRMAVASLLVAFPLYLYLVATTEKAVRNDPAKRVLGVRKWLIYLTLFVTGGIIIGDVITLVYGFLAGENDVRSGAKLFVLLGIAGMVFLNEAWKLRRSDAVNERVSPWRKAVAGLAVTAVVASVAGGLFMAGPPGQERAQRMDAMRSNNLAGIGYGLYGWWHSPQGGTLPDRIEVLVEKGIITEQATDPETGELYGYRVASESSIEVCATFATDSAGGTQPKPRPVDPSGTSYPIVPDLSRHAAGRQCFIIELGPPKVP